MVVWGVWLAGFALMFLGLPVWLVLGAIQYVAGRRGRRAAAAAGGYPEASAPAVTVYARPAKIIAFVTAGVLGVAAAPYALDGGSRLSGPVRVVSDLLFVSAPTLLTALVVISILSIADTRSGRRVAGADTAIAYAVTAGAAAVVLVMVLTGVLHGEQIGM